MTDLDIIAELGSKEISLIQANEDNIKILEQKKQSYYILENNQVKHLTIYKKKIDNSIFIMITKLSQLGTLELNYTKIRKIPNRISTLTKLFALDLANNEISEISENLFELTNLSLLNLSNNKIVSIPKNISKLKNIWDINLSKNKIKEIPRSLLDFENLIHFNLDYNPLTTEPFSKSKMKRKFVNIKNSMFSIFQPFNYDINSIEFTNTMKKILNFDFFYDQEQQINFLLHIQDKTIDWWEINAITTIMRSDCITSNAILDKQNFFEIFKDDSEAKEHYQRIINFLIQFKLAFKLNENEVLIPSKVSHKIPISNIELFQEKLNFMYIYTKTLKNSFFYQFLVEMNDFIDRSLDNQIWRKGVLLSYKSLKAIVILENNKNSITIYIDNPNVEGREFLAIIRDKFNRINKDIDCKECIPIFDAKGNVIDCKDAELLKNDKITTTIPLIITEGKTDWKHLKKALERFQKKGKYLDLYIEFKEFNNISTSDTELANYAESLAKQVNVQKTICIFDRDLSSRLETYGKTEFTHVANKQLINIIKGKCKNEYGERSKKYLDIEKELEISNYKKIDEEIKSILTGKEYEEWKVILNNNVYAFCIPKINSQLNEICIEFYYKEEDLKKEDSHGKRLFTADEFKFNEQTNDCNQFISKCGKFKTDTQSGNNKNTKHITLQYPNQNDRGYVYRNDDEECNKSTTMNLSKNEFAENIYNEVEGFNDFDIENFRLIFDVIEKIIND